MFFARPTTLDQQSRTNFNHLYFDMVWFGVLAGSALAFLSIYSARIGASSFEMGLLTAGPGLVNLFFSLPAGRWLEGKPLIQTTFRSSILSRLGYLAIIPLPWILSRTGQIWGVIGIILVVSIPGTLLAIAFNALFAITVPPEWRTQVVGRRNAVFAVMVTVTSILCGKILDSVVFPLNYQIVFLLGAGGAMLSSYHLGKICLPGETSVRIRGSLMTIVSGGSRRILDGLRQPLDSLVIKDNGKPMLRLDLLRGPFGSFMLAYLLFYTFQYVTLPLFPLYNVNLLHLTDGDISLGTAFFYIVMTVVSLGLNRVSARRGPRSLLVLGSLLFGAFPLLMYLARDAGLYLAANIAGGGIWAVLNAGLVNRLMERVPENDRPAHMALHNIALNLGILAGSMIGPLFVSQVGLRDVILIGAGLRLVGGLLMVIWG